MADALTRPQRDLLVARISELEKSLLRVDGPDALAKTERPLARERLYATLAEYADRLPRARLSMCPYCAAPLKRVFDPFGIDGPWWFVDVTAKYEEPAPCDHFRVLLGALSLGDRVPREAISEVRPGPAVPFVVPALLEKPGMKAVVSRTELATGDVAYPIAYFADRPTRPIDLHQPWCRDMYWFPDETGKMGWSIANDTFDFELVPYVEKGQLNWVDLNKVEGWSFAEAAKTFPFLNVKGDRERQQIAGGQRALLGLPSGVLVDPFE